MTREEMIDVVVTAIQADEVLMKVIRLSAVPAISAMTEEQLSSIITTLQLGE